MLRKQQNSSFAKLTDSTCKIKYNTVIDYAQVVSDFIKIFSEYKIGDYVDYSKLKYGCATLGNN